MSVFKFFGLVLALAAAGCWHSSQGLLNEADAVQPFQEGTYLERDWTPEVANAPDQTIGQPIVVTKRGRGYRAQFGPDGDAFDLIVVPLKTERLGTYAYQAAEACAKPPCDSGESGPHIVYGILGVRKDGRIERVEPEAADPEGAVAKAGRATCDASNLCEFKSREALMAALAKIAGATPSNIYELKR